VVQFIEEFWRRRDPHPSEPGNPFLETFFERVQAADSIYGEGELRGSLSDRGRALIVLGPPPILRQGRRKGPRHEALRAGTQGEQRARWVVTEEWEYPSDTLPPELLEELPKDHQAVVLVFLEGHHRTSLVEGEKFLEIAARVAAHPN
jgi:GWxTD domain-containing protein